MDTEILNYYENKHNLLFPKSKIKALYLLDYCLYCETDFGICKKSIYDIGKYSFGISSAVDKTDFIKRKFKTVHGDRYDYSLVKYVEANNKIKIICPEHGIFKQTPNSHIHKNGCMECGVEKTTNSKKISLEEFISRSNKIHNNKYDYSLVKYNFTKEKIKIICPIHGEFEQNANSHLIGYGCAKCGFDYVGKIHAKNPSGWKLENWKNAANRSKKFDSFKVYILKCWNDEEEFYKIGRTFLTINNRFRYRIPYKFKAIKVFMGDAKYIFDLENKLKSKNKDNKYIPLLKFNGMYECFTKIINDYD
jgi:nuclear transport factor 2 (NTF2) superfamily protein